MAKRISSLSTPLLTMATALNADLQALGFTPFARNHGLALLAENGDSFVSEDYSAVLRFIAVQLDTLEDTLRSDYYPDVPELTDAGSALVFRPIHFKR